MKFFLHIIDDEKTVAQSIKRVLQTEDREIEISNHADEALKKAREKYFDLFLLDYRLGDTDGITLLKQLKEIAPNAIYIIITAFGTIKIAVEAMKLGAFDFIQKDQNPEVMRFTVQRALDNLRLRKEVEEMRTSAFCQSHLPSIIAQSPAMKQVLEIADKFAETDSTILLTGETGTGKNLLAEYIHRKSPRFMYPFTAINSCAIPSNLLESELFGYEKGAFTGAKTNGKVGLIERTNNGTLFLDEIGELSLDLQAKLLHVIERQEFYRIGSVESQKINVRIIAATNVDLQKMVEEKRFRLDLFYRLNVATIQLPPLRQRKEDIIPLTKLFVDEYNKRFNKHVSKLSEDVKDFLVNAPWNGNIRELRNLIERVMILINDENLTYEEILKAFNPFNLNTQQSHNGYFNLNLSPKDGTNLIQQAQRELVQQALKKTEGNRSSAARLLGIPRTTLNFYIEKYRNKSKKSKYVDFNEKYWEFERKVRDGYTFKTLEPIYRRYIKWIKAILIKHRNMENNSKISILDIGCGFGYFLKLCDEEGWETYGVDISEYAIGRARSITKAKLFVHDVEKGLPMFNEDFFDIVTMIDVLEHLYSPFKVVKEIYRILKPGGFMIITTPNLNALARFLWKIIGKEKRWYGFIDETHIHLFTPL